MIEKDFQIQSTLEHTGWKFEGPLTCGSFSTVNNSVLQDPQLVGSMGV